jgi:ubiquinone/menaquinone biosynthesis C-methylase UbiE
VTLSLEQSTLLCRLLADASRQRLLLLLESDELSVTELTAVTGLSQGRVSTHLAKLRRAGLVNDRRVRATTYFRAATEEADDAVTHLWHMLRERIDDQQAELDRERARELIRTRSAGQSWAETVAGRMELHYSPGRTWEATARTVLALLQLGDVLDIGSGDGVLAELLAHRARSMTCVDISGPVLDAARQRLQPHQRVNFVRADMNALPFADACYDQVFLMHALPYARHPAQVVREAARMLRPGGALLVATLLEHGHEVAVESYDHVNQGISIAALNAHMMAAGLQVAECQIACREPKPPYFEVITALAHKL